MDYSHIYFTLFHYFTGLPSTDYEHVVEFLGWAVATPVGVQVIKHIKNWHEEKRLVHFLNGVGSIFTTLVFLYNSGLFNNITLGNKVSLSALMAAASSVVYRLMVSPLYPKVVAKLSASDAAASAFLAEKNTTEPTTTPDFS